MAAGIGLGISMGWTYIKKALGPTVDGIFAILQGRSQFFENETSSKAQVQVLDTAGVLGKASLLITPTAYNTGKLNAVLPSSSPFGDINKAGGTNATRINSSGNVEVISSSYPRIDYEESEPAILSEYQTSNHLQYSEDIWSGRSPWTSSGVGSGTVLMTLPDGSVANVRNHYAYGNPATISQTITSIVGRGVGVSVWAYNPETTAHTITLKAVGYATTPVPLSLPPGVWTRVKFITPAGASPYTITGVEFELANGKNTRLWGAQLEPSQFLNRSGVVTSYIPSTGSITTRVNELFVGQVDSSRINSEEGVFLAECKMTNSGTNEFINLVGDGGVGNNSISIYGTSGGTVTGRMMTPGNPAQYFPLGGTVNKFTGGRYAIKWDGTTIKTFTNGTLVHTVAQDNSFSAGVLNQLNLSTGQRFYGKFKMLAVFNQALTDAEVIAITT